MRTTALTGATIPAPSPGTTAGPTAAAPETGARAMPAATAVAAGRTSPSSSRGGPVTGNSAFRACPHVRRTGVPSDRRPPHHGCLSLTDAYEEK